MDVFPLVETGRTPFFVTEKNKKSDRTVGVDENFWKVGPDLPYSFGNLGNTPPSTRRGDGGVASWRRRSKEAFHGGVMEHASVMEEERRPIDAPSSWHFLIPT